jgi:hypothetical protein
MPVRANTTKHNGTRHGKMHSCDSRDTCGVLQSVAVVLGCGAGFGEIMGVTYNGALVAGCTPAPCWEWLMILGLLV